MVQFYVFVCTNKKRKVSNTVQEKGTQQVQAAERHTGVWQKQRRSKLARSDPTMEEGKQNDLQRSLRNINIYIYIYASGMETGNRLNSTEVIPRCGH